MAEILTILRQTLEREAPVAFARFMEIALYCPDLGYYEQERSRPGAGGDFYTSVSVGTLFGEMLAFQFAEWLAAGGEGEPVQLVEAGAHDGRLAVVILSWLQSHRPEVFRRLQYWLVEPSARRQGWQRKRLEPFGNRVSWAASLPELPAEGIDGVIFSNELLDAFPVHRLGWDSATRGWFEWGVGLAGDRFVWQRLSRPVLDWSGEMAEAGLVVPPGLAEVLPDGFVVEVCPAARQWWSAAAASLRRGRLLTFDYGLAASELLVPERAGGTVRAYYRHHAVADVLARPGAQDLTAQVNFSQLRRAGEQKGLSTEQFLSQSLFLTRVAGRMWGPGSELGAPSAGQAVQFRTLTHPDHLGRSFRVLIQQTGNCREAER